MKALVLVAALALAAAPAFAADAPKPAPGPAAADAKAKDKAKEPKKEEKLICTREADTGSFLAKRVCKTQEQIDSERRAYENLESDRQQLSNNPNLR